MSCLIKLFIKKQSMFILLSGLRERLEEQAVANQRHFIELHCSEYVSELAGWFEWLQPFLVKTTFHLIGP